MSTSEHSDYGDFEKRLQEIFSDEKGDYVRTCSINGQRGLMSLDGD